MNHVKNVTNFLLKLGIIIETVEPNETGLRMLHEIENDRRCYEFVSTADAMKELSL